jgi:hypothetical protein
MNSEPTIQTPSVKLFVSRHFPAIPDPVCPGHEISGWVWKGCPYTGTVVWTNTTKSRKLSTKMTMKFRAHQARPLILTPSFPTRNIIQPRPSGQALRLSTQHQGQAQSESTKAAASPPVAPCPQIFVTRQSPASSKRLYGPSIAKYASQIYHPVCQSEPSSSPFARVWLLAECHGGESQLDGPYWKAL